MLVKHQPLDKFEAHHALCQIGAGTYSDLSGCNSSRYLEIS